MGFPPLHVQNYLFGFFGVFMFLTSQYDFCQKENTSKPVFSNNWCKYKGDDITASAEISKLNGVAPLVTDPPWAHSTQLWYPSIWKPPLYNGNISEPIISAQNETKGKNLSSSECVNGGTIGQILSFLWVSTLNEDDQYSEFNIHILYF